MEWYNKSNGITYRILSEYGFPYVVITQQEEEDLKSMFKVKDTAFTITNDTDKLGPEIDKLMDQMGDVFHNITGEKKKLNFTGFFVVIPFILFLLFVVFCYSFLYIRRVAFKKILYQEEIQSVYNDTTKRISDRYEKRILGLAGIKNEKNRHKRNSQ